MAWTLEEAVAYYKSQGAPGDQLALISLLREIQQENNGSIPGWLLKAAARSLETKEGVLLALVKRIPSLRLADTHILEMCAGPNCGKAAELAKLAESVKAAGGNFTLKFVPCMRLCGKGPNVRVDGELYHKVDTQLLRKLLVEAGGGK